MDILFSFYWIFSVVTVLVVISYVVFIGLLTIGIFKSKSFVSSDLLPKTAFSIIVPFRNEAENLPKLLHSISLLNYPKELFEIILVDDESDDSWELEAGSWEFVIQLIKNKKKSNSPKKDAIETAIQVAKHDWIITTDADCIVPENWLKTLDNYIQTEKKKMVVAGVIYEEKSEFLHRFQQLDLLSLQGTTIGSFWLQEPFLCNGANFAYEKAFFHGLDGFMGNKNIASGDDVFLLQKAVRYNRDLVGYCKNVDCVVTTQSVTSWRELFQQRVRWAAKTTKIKLFAGKAIALSVFLFNFFIVWNFLENIVVAVVYGVTNFDEFFYYSFNPFGLYFYKILVDGLLLYATAKFFKVSLKGFLFSLLLYPFFSVAVVFYSFFGTFEWKGRTFKK